MGLDPNRGKGLYDTWREKLPGYMPWEEWSPDRQAAWNALYDQIHDREEALKGRIRELEQEAIINAGMLSGRNLDRAPITASEIQEHCRRLAAAGLSQDQIARLITPLLAALPMPTLIVDKLPEGMEIGAGGVIQEATDAITRDRYIPECISMPYNYEKMFREHIERITGLTPEVLDQSRNDALARDPLENSFEPEDEAEQDERLKHHRSCPLRLWRSSCGLHKPECTC